MISLIESGGKRLWRDITRSQIRGQVGVDLSFGCITAKPEIETIANAATRIASDPAKVFELMKKVSKIEGAALNLRSILLEMIVAHLLKQDGYDIEIRQKVTDSEGNAAEIDVRAEKRTDWIGCECKAKGPGVLVSAQEIEDWLDRPLPRIKDYLKRIGGASETRSFRFYSSTDYTDDARNLIERVRSTHRRQPIRFLSAKEILSELRARKETALVDIFVEQFT